MLGRIIFGALDATLAVLEAGSKTYDRGKKLIRLIWPRRGPTDGASVPWTYKDVEHQQQQIRSATAHRVAQPDRVPVRR